MEGLAGELIEVKRAECDLCDEVKLYAEEDAKYEGWEPWYEDRMRWFRSDLERRQRCLNDALANLARYMKKHGLTDAHVKSVRYPRGICYVSQHAPEYLAFTHAMYDVDAYRRALAKSAENFDHRWNMVDEFDHHKFLLEYARRELTDTIAWACVLSKLFPIPVVERILRFMSR